MFAPLLYLLCLSGLASAQVTYTVWSTVLFLRTGDRTPLSLGDIPTTLTPLGSRQLQSVGAFFRERYITSSDRTSNTSLGAAPLQGLSAHVPTDAQLYLLALDMQYTAASAQAFMQGFYPPYTLNSSDAGGSAGTDLNELGFLGNGTYIEAPLDGYQYARIQVASEYDYNSIYVGGSLNCPALTNSVTSFYDSGAFASTFGDSVKLYEDVGKEYLEGIAPSTTWSVYDAYPIYDYINWMATHNTTVNGALRSSDAVESSSVTNASYLDQLRWYADAQQTAILGNVSTPNAYGHALESASVGGISTIAGATFASKVLIQLANAIEYRAEYYKMSVLVGDYDAFTSFFALASLPDLNSNFRGLPDFASSMAFELFSTTDASAGFPDASDLWVRFLFRNGTDDSTSTATQTGADDANNDNLPGGFQSYPLFGRGPSETDMRWADFAALMRAVAVAGPGDWCSACGADAFPSVWCAAWNSSLAFAGPDTSSSSSSSSSSGSGASTGARRYYSHSPAVIGVIGAAIALAAVGLAGCVAALCGVRVKRHGRGQKRDGAGGFKGATKLGSDTDLSVPAKGGAVVGASVERKGSLGDDGIGAPVPGGRERVGSWELKDTRAGAGGAFGRMGVSAESLDVGAQPTRVEERV
ncbi:hypothetical protein MBLNU459_g2864t1 [Dothideomycetes sp. NU459]